MKFPVKSHDAAREDVGALVVGVREGRAMSAAAKAVDKASKHHLTEAMAGGGFEGKAGQCLALYRVPGIAGSTAVHFASPDFLFWANGHVNFLPGPERSNFDDPAEALGPPSGDTLDDVFHVVSLGRGGRITLTFPQRNADADGPDFAVFEKGITNTFLLLLRSEGIAVYHDRIELLLSGMFGNRLKVWEVLPFEKITRISFGFYAPDPDEPETVPTLNLFVKGYSLDIRGRRMLAYWAR